MMAAQSELEYLTQEQVDAVRTHVLLFLLYTSPEIRQSVLSGWVRNRKDNLSVLLFTCLHGCDSYLRLPGFLSHEETAALLTRAKRLLESFSLEDHPLVSSSITPLEILCSLYAIQTKFTTGDDNHVGDEYFLDSGDKIRYFLEDGAVIDGKLTREKEKAVNKIGHGEFTSVISIIDES